MSTVSRQQRPCKDTVLSPEKLFSSVQASGLEDAKEGRETTWQPQGLTQTLGFLWSSAVTPLADPVRLCLWGGGCQTHPSGLLHPLGHSFSALFLGLCLGLGPHLTRGTQTLHRFPFQSPSLLFRGLLTKTKCRGASPEQRRKCLT